MNKVYVLNLSRELRSVAMTRPHIHSRKRAFESESCNLFKKREGLAVPWVLMDHLIKTEVQARASSFMKIDLKKEQNSYLYEAFIYPILLVTRPFGKYGCWPTKNCKPRIFSSGGYHFGDFLQLIDQTIHGRLQPFIDAQQFVLLFYETNAFIDKR